MDSEMKICIHLYWLILSNNTCKRVKEADWQRRKWKSNVVATDHRQFYREI